MGPQTCHCGKLVGTERKQRKANSLCARYWDNFFRWTNHADEERLETSDDLTKRGLMYG